MKKSLFLLPFLLLGCMIAKSQDYSSETSVSKKSFLLQQQQKAFKAVFENRDILDNYNTAVIKDGKIIKLSKAMDYGGISFWHEHRNTLSNPPADYTCVITDPSWQNTGWTATCNTCGYATYQLSDTASYEPTIPNLYLLPDMYDDSMFDTLYSDVLYEITDLPILRNIAIHYYHDTSSEPEREVLFRNHHIVQDVMPDIVAISSQGYINKNTYPPLSTNDWDLFYTYYLPTENSQILTLKSGNYIELLQTGYFLTNNWWEGYVVILKWFRFKVENYYLGDVSISENHPVEASMKLYPNPTADVVNVQLTMNNEQLNNVKIQLFDMFGKMLGVVETGTSEQTRIDLSRYANGVYFVKTVADGNVIGVKKVVKQ